MQVPQYTKTKWEDNKTWVEQEALNKLEDQVAVLTDVAIKSSQFIEELLTSNAELQKQIIETNKQMATMTESFNTLYKTIVDHIDY